MIVVDTSAILAILRKEPEAERFVRALARSEHCLMSAVSYFEASLVMIGRGPPEAAEDLDALIRRAAIDIVPFDHDLATRAKAAFVRFGKGRHPAGLNLGDCASYALAHARGLPLLYKGGDFSRTDIGASPA